MRTLKVKIETRTADSRASLADRYPQAGVEGLEAILVQRERSGRRQSTTGTLEEESAPEADRDPGSITSPGKAM